jgi:hypothetical protein
MSNNEKTDNINVVKNSDRQQDVMNTVMKFRVPENVKHSLTSCTSISP